MESRVASLIPVGTWQWSAEQRVLRRGDRELHLTKKERQLLGYLCDRVGQTVETGELLTEVWEYSPKARSRAVENTVSRLRKKLGPDGLQVQTVPGRGYVLVAPRDSDLVGRDVVLAELERLLSEHRIVQLHGFGGAGKTRVARALQDALGSSVWIDARSAKTQASFLAILAHRLDLEAREPSAALVGDALQDGGIALLVIDAAEHLGPWHIDLARTWTQRAPALHVITTTRVEVDGAPSYGLEALGAAHAVQLLRSRRAMRQPTLELSAAEERELVGLLDGNPLAIELAAARLRLLGVPDLLDRLRRSVSVLDGPEGRIRSTVDWAWQLLDAKGRAVLVAASWFPETFSVEALEQITGLNEVDALEGLDQLRRAAIVGLEEGQLRILDLIRGHALQHADGSERAAFVAWAARDAERHYRALQDGGHADATWHRPANVWVAALAHAEDPVERAWLAIALYRHDRVFGPLSRSAAAFDGLTVEGLPSWLAVQLTSDRALRWLDIDDRPQAVRYAEAAVALLDQSAPLSQRIDTRVRLAWMVRCARGPAPAYALAKSLVAEAEAQRAEPHRLYGALFELNCCLSQLGRYDEAYRVGLRMLSLAGSNVSLEAKARDLVGYALYQLGRTEEAIVQEERAVELNRVTGRRRVLAHSALRLGEFLQVLGRHEDARVVLTEALTAARSVQTVKIQLAARIGLAQLDPPVRALPQLEAVREEARAAGLVREGSMSTALVGTARHRLGDFEGAAASYGEALESLEALGWANAMDKVRLWRAVLHAAEGQLDEARSFITTPHSGSVITAHKFVLARAAVFNGPEAYIKALDAMPQGVRAASGTLIALIEALGPRFREPRTQT